MKGEGQREKTGALQGVTYSIQENTDHNLYLRKLLKAGMGGGGETLVRMAENSTQGSYRTGNSICFHQSHCKLHTLHFMDHWSSIQYSLAEKLLTFE